MCTVEPCRQSEQSQGTAAWCAVGVLYLPSRWAGMPDSWLKKQVIPREKLASDKVTVFRSLGTGGCFMTKDRDLVIDDKLIQLFFF